MNLPSITPFAKSGKRAVILWLDDVVYDIDQAWEPAFKRARLRYDSVGWAAVDLPRQAVTSNCKEPLSGRPIGPFPHGAPFYCPAGGDVVSGNVDHGVIYFGALGISDIALRLLGGDVIHQPVTFDLLVYILVGHEMGHHVQTELLNRNPSKTLGQAWLELGADCLSGVYIHHAWPPTAFSKADLRKALKVLSVMPNDLPSLFTERVDRDSDSRVDAFMRGFRDGDAVGCLTNEW